MFLKIFLFYLYSITTVGGKNNNNGDGNSNGNINGDNVIDIEKIIQTIRQRCYDVLTIKEKKNEMINTGILFF